jgi:hypothetical protein
MAAPHVTSKVVIWGTPGVGKKTVLQGLYKLGNVSFSADKPLPLSNKYFDVDLHFVIARVDQPEVLRDAEAVILVVSATDDCSAAVASIARLSAELPVEAEPQLVLVLSNKADIALGVGFDSDTFSHSRSACDATDGPAPYRALVSELDSAALDKGYEHVPCCALAPHFTSQSRDKAGLARAFEALANVAWRSARMRSSRGAAGADSHHAEGSASSSSVSVQTPAVHQGVPQASTALADLVRAEKGLVEAARGVGAASADIADAGDNDDEDGAAGLDPGIARLMEEVSGSDMCAPRLASLVSWLYTQKESRSASRPSDPHFVFSCSAFVPSLVSASDEECTVSCIARLNDRCAAA